MSLDEKALSRRRGPNGELPKIQFMRLKPGSLLIDRGKRLRFAYSGTAPDLDAFEYDGGPATLSFKDLFK